MRVKDYDYKNSTITEGGTTSNSTITFGNSTSIIKKKKNHYYNPLVFQKLLDF